MQGSLGPMNELHLSCPYGQKGLDVILPGIFSSLNDLQEAKTTVDVRLDILDGSERVSDELRTLSTGIQRSADTI